MDNFGWCFIGAGNIARKVARDTPGIRIASVCAAHIENARRFAEEFGGLAFDNAEDALRADGVEGVYVAVQHPEHHALVMRALDMGKPVLCEKPLAVNARQAKEMIGRARSKGLYLAEAMWPRFNPILQAVREWISSGEMGEVHYMTADFAESEAEAIGAYRNSRDRAGGSLLDMGIYPIAMAGYIFGRTPKNVYASGALSGDGVDGRVAFMLDYGEGVAASLFSAMDTASRWTCTLHGERGVITIPEYWRARSAKLSRKDGAECAIRREGCVGWGYQMEAVAREIAGGLTESPEMPMDESLGIARIMDDIREQIGLVYPWD